jgi:hypothetical protein
MHVTGGVVYIVVIVFAKETEDRGIESHQGVMLLGLCSLQCCSLKLNSHCYCLWWSEINVKNSRINAYNLKIHRNIAIIFLLPYTLAGFEP